jgi:hypothetical protein
MKRKKKLAWITLKSASTDLTLLKPRTTASRLATKRTRIPLTMRGLRDPIPACWSRNTKDKLIIILKQFLIASDS